ncbi:hypothetical protein AAES_14467 [Amazona aestiva]|uniref:5-demethoxyubiquinone hydroxylase, mitochondrial n=1 Tax=Amazona aestiva TaxID=12930 RepID=A0A0Q3XBW9_AMAAE|nr:hypothetical protein AAES_14467 [Amazona aestiva]
MPVAAAGGAPAVLRSLGRCRALRGGTGPRGRWALPAGGWSLRLRSTRVSLEGINRPVVDRIIRVDHAGEYGANRIYAGQMAVLGRSSVGPIIRQMWNQEKDHLKKFNELMVAYRVRPTVLLPFWNVAGFVLGAGSALLGKKGAMACTVAVEESISDHYNNQIRTLVEEDPEKYEELLQIIKQFRDDEREHHDIGIEHDAEAEDKKCRVATRTPRRVGASQDQASGSLVKLQAAFNPGHRASPAVPLIQRCSASGGYEENQNLELKVMVIIVQPIAFPEYTTAIKNLINPFYSFLYTSKKTTAKAHVGRVVAELVRAAKAQGLQPGPLALSLRGDFVRIGSAYEQHKVRSPDCFDILVPLRLPPHLEPLPGCAEGLGPHGAFVCGLRARGGWPRRYRPFSEGFCVELQGRCHLSSALVLRWFQGHLQRCLGAVRYRLQERCRISLSACPGRPPVLHIVPCSDYVCCHISMAVRLIPAIPIGDALYLTALPPEGPLPAPAPEALWGLNASRQEQRLLSWLKEQAPASSCHLKCLQILKGLRDLRGQGLEEPFSSQWSRGPLEAWDERFLVERLEDLVLYLRDCLRKQEATPVNLLAAFDGLMLDLTAFQLINTWIQAPHIIRMQEPPAE